jgi:mannose-6-phosphate isomerase-like protein (cupin superfamily)
METQLFGFESCSDPGRTMASVAAGGACFGFVSHGEVEITEPGLNPVTIGAQQFFGTAGGLALRLSPAARVVVAQRWGYVGLRVRGGPIEDRGRLRYIDGCSDSVLAPPARRGDPCLNHLHFPAGVEQTEHHHPSVRTGIVTKGRGWCLTPTGRTRLDPGMIFCIPANGRHRFVTEDSHLDVIAYHPDTDFGPTDDDHPMINRTWFDDDQV